MGKNNYPKISIVVLNWNGLKYTTECLESLKKTTYPNYEIIIVDNGSKGNDADILEEKYKGYIELIRIKENLGWFGATNFIIKQLTARGGSDYLLFLNNDTKIIQEDWLEKLVKTGEKEKNIGIVGCTLLFPSGKFQLGGRILKPPFQFHFTTGIFSEVDISDNVKDSIEVDVVEGACFMVKKKVIDEIGLFDEKFGAGHYEDGNYQIRAKRVGFKVIYVPDVKIIHYGSASIDDDKITENEYGNKQGYLRFALLNFSLSGIILCLPYMFAVCFFERKDKDKEMSLINLKIRKYWLGYFNYSLRAIWDNLKVLNEISYRRKNPNQKVWS
jgi:GT2 family glycosyltransferase